jgi:chromosome segregation ATPase
MSNLPQKAEKRRERVTYEEVAAACEALSDDQQRPSVRLVMQRVGGGSPKTINDFLRAWERVQEGASSLGDLGVHVSDEFKAALAQELAAVGGQIRKEVGARQEELEELYALAQESGDAARQQIGELEGQLREEQKQRQGAELQLQQQIASLQARLTDETSRQQAATTGVLEARTAMHQAELTAAELRARLEGAQTELERERTTRRDLEKALTPLRDALTAAQQQVAVSQATEQANGRAIEALTLQLKQADQRSAQAQEEAQQSRQQRDAMNKKAEVAAAQLQAAEGQMEYLRQDRAVDKDWLSKLAPAWASLSTAQAVQPKSIQE